jgi:hypothetical protein
MLERVFPRSLTSVDVWFPMYWRRNGRSMALLWDQYQCACSNLSEGGLGSGNSPGPRGYASSRNAIEIMGLWGYSACGNA